MPDLHQKADFAAKRQILQAYQPLTALDGLAALVGLMTNKECFLRNYSGKESCIEPESTRPYGWACGKAICVLWYGSINK